MGLSVQELEDAERILQQIVAQQALAAARSPGCRDAKHLRTAIDEGKAVGLTVEELEHAEHVLTIQYLIGRSSASGEVLGSSQVTRCRRIIRSSWVGMKSLDVLLRSRVTPGRRQLL